MNEQKDTRFDFDKMTKEQRNEFNLKYWRGEILRASINGHLTRSDVKNLTCWIETIFNRDTVKLNETSGVKNEMV